ncbi:response regulator [Rhizobium sp. K1/93]|nr:response regulator [Rhizobium sp. L58/93]MBO9170418.1 response regulator [Rhizobium sp. L245/93]MBO9186378.1 response regulator [Rhizobium sp. E27B/91]QXZ87429.1 response regulator [Rhizobium sp. K1/93]QXZ93416.1 response regulator [Rhizobium sp. K15/93]QYA04928.1 response regulator [Rhizobium sp. B21/90]
MILAPGGRDADVASSLLSAAKIVCRSAGDLHSFVAALSDHVAFGVLTEETVRSSDLKPLASWIAGQPSWSDMPFIVLTQRGGGPEKNPAAARLSEILGNVTFLERPFHATTFISVARTAMKGRQRQYEARARLYDLADGERRLQAALEAGRLGSWELELKANRLMTSALFRTIFGQPKDGALSYEQLLATIHGDDLPRLKRAISLTVETGRDCEIDFRCIWPDATQHWVDVRAQLYRDRNGGAQKLVGIASDITKRRAAEDTLKSVNDLLEERVSLRTAELKAANAGLIEEVAQRERAEEQLRQAQKMEVIGQLTGGVAHDFNNLLMAVLGNLDLLRKHFQHDPKASRLIDGAVQGAKRGAALTQRLLAFARRQDLSAEPTDLGKLVTGMEDLLKRSVGTTIAIEVLLEDNLMPAMIDSNQVELALLNLVVNARDAMPSGGVIKVRVRGEEIREVSKDLTSGRYLVLSVEDTGTGMSEQTLMKAVDPFFSTKEVGKGTGLGLSMVHGLALQLKGSLRLTSAVGHGTFAELWLPETFRPISIDDALEPGGIGVTRAIRILMVDDDALIAMASVDMLEDLGHEVVEANSGADALKYLESGNTFDLMITDYSMPGMTGAELAKAVREKVPGMPILIATGYADLPAGSGMDLPRLGKPYTQAQLAAEIGKVLHRG